MIKKSNPNISALFAVIIAFGITISNTHVHIHEFHDAGANYVSVDEELHCVICGSVVNFNPEAYTQSFYKDTPELSLFSEKTEHANQPYNKFQEGRSPPAVV